MEKRMRIIRGGLIVLLLILVAYIALIVFGFRREETVAVVGSRSKTMELYTLKGTIYDKDLQPLTNGQSCYYLLVDPRGFSMEDLSKLAALTEKDETLLRQKLEKESVFLLQSGSKPKDIGGVYAFEGVQRYQNVATHLIGYVNSDLAGVTALEKSYDAQLSYFGGRKEITFSADARRNPITGLGITVQGDAGNYKDGVITTLNRALQEALERSMEQHIEKGAAVVLDIRSGEIRAIASAPDFDANHIDAYLQGADGELINRALSEQTVGSVFKIVVAAAAIEAGIDDFAMPCNGTITVDDRDFGCPREGGHGEMDIESAFAESCNVYFISLGQMLGTEKVMEMAKRLGFGQAMEIADGLWASAGTLPDVTGAPAKQLANISIGQGDLMATPLQIARLLALCGNGGYLLSPTCFQGFYVEGKVQSEKWLDYKTEVLDKAVAERLKALCVETVEKGTGRAAKPEEGGAGGKTSSAQTGVFLADGREVLNTYFAGFYPAKEPRYAIAVFAENGESGGATCAPVFKEVCDFIGKND